VNHSFDIFGAHRVSGKRRLLYFDFFTVKDLFDAVTTLDDSKERSLRYKTLYSESLSILVCEAGMNYNTKYSQNHSRFLGGFSVAVAPILECPRRTLAYLVEREKSYLLVPRHVAQSNGAILKSWSQDGPLTSIFVRFAFIDSSFTRRLCICSRRGRYHSIEN
jgi:hypothetical protein